MYLLKTLDFVLVSVIENLPMEMRDRLTEMREMDLQVQSKFLWCTYQLEYVE